MYWWRGWSYWRWPRSVGFCWCLWETHARPTHLLTLLRGPNAAYA